MARLFSSEGDDKRLHAPATLRNRDVIFDVLQSALSAQPRVGTVFEVASGTGEHAAYMAPKLTNHFWQPSDIDDDHIVSINAWREECSADNFLPAVPFNLLKDNFHTHQCPQPIVAILGFNLIHISPWTVTEALISKAGAVLEENGFLYLYGPYKRGGEHTAASNAEFDLSLKSRDTQWGIRDMEEVIERAVQAGFSAPEITPMPANNHSLVFRKQLVGNP